MVQTIFFCILPVLSSFGHYPIHNGLLNFIEFEELISDQGTRVHVTICIATITIVCHSIITILFSRGHALPGSIFMLKSMLQFVLQPSL